MEVEQVDFINVPTRDSARALAVCLDPDGNALILHRRYEPYEQG